MTEAEQTRTIALMQAHFSAARNLRSGASQNTKNAPGLMKSARYHVARARALAKELCRPGVGAPDCEENRQAKTG